MPKRTSMGEICRMAAGSKGQRYDIERRGSRESRAVPAPEANAELISSMQVTVFLACKGISHSDDAWKSCND